MKGEGAVFCHSLRPGLLHNIHEHSERCYSTSYLLRCIASEKTFHLSSVVTEFVNRCSQTPETYPPAHANLRKTGTQEEGSSVLDHRDSGYSLVIGASRWSVKLNEVQLHLPKVALA